jgi:hypothetical protein
MGGLDLIFLVPIGETEQDGVVIAKMRWSNPEPNL